MSAKLYEYAVILNEKRDKDDEITEEASVLVSPTYVLAKDEKQAQLLAGRAIPEANMNDLDRLVLVVRPF